mmetsp:Transcript_24036/g.66775  ORF Transcript_24036/g.66775 Transcript_24036/m.66775 type:complete len:707 (-) Transcript_24036:1535-3655(-)
MLSGEPLTASCLKAVRQTLVSGDCTVLNLYGSTEVAADCTAFDVINFPHGRHRLSGFPADVEPPTTAQDIILPLGSPISSFVVMVVQYAGSRPAEDVSTPSGGVQELQLAPQGTEGRIAVSGLGVANGYFRDRELTSSRFARLILCSDEGAAAKAKDSVAFCGPSCPQAPLKPSRVVCPPEWPSLRIRSSALPPWAHGSPCFLTDDLGTMDSSGTLDFSSRIGHYVKVSGEFVNLLQLEHELQRAPWISEAAARAWPSGEGSYSSIIVAYLVPSAQAHRTRRSVLLCATRQLVRLSPELSDAAAPAAVVLMKALPRSSSGKVLRQALPRPGADCPTEPLSGCTPGRAPGKPTHAQQGEEAVMRAFRKSLHVRTGCLEATSNFFLHGGDSLAAAHVAETLGVPIAMVIQHPTVRSLAQEISRGSTVAGHPHKLPHAPTFPSMTRPPLLLHSGSVPASCLLAMAGVGRSSPRLVALNVAPAVAVSSCGRVQHLELPLPAPQAAVAAARPSLPIPPPQSSQSLDVHERRVASENSQGRVVCVWRAPMEMCVDTEPLLLLPQEAGGPLETEATLSPTQQWQTPLLPDSSRVLCCSHGGDVALLRGSDGATVWRVTLPSRADSGVAVTRDLSWAVVGCGDSCLYFLELATGKIGGSWAADGELRSPPVVDSWDGHVWVTSHGCRLAVLTVPAMPTAPKEGTSSEDPQPHPP